MGRHKAATTQIYNRKRKLKQKQAKLGDQTKLHSRQVTSSQPLPCTPICVSTCTRDSDSENSLPPFVDSRLCSNQCTASNNSTSTECTTSTVKTKPLPDTPICASTCTQDSYSENSLPPFVDSRLCSNQCTASNNSSSTKCTTSTVKTKQSSLPDWEFLNDPLFIRFREYTLLRHRMNKVSCKL